MHRLTVSYLYCISFFYVPHSSFFTRLYFWKFVRYADQAASEPNSLANAELYLTLASMIRLFDFELHDTMEEDIEITWDGFAGGFRPESRGIRVRAIRKRATA